MTDASVDIQALPTRCSLLSRTLHERLAGTAGHRRGWVLLEQPGPWGRHPLTESRLDPAVGAELESRCNALNLQVVVIRRHGRYPDPAPAPWAFLVRTDAEQPWIEGRQVESPAELLDADLFALASGSRPRFGEQVGGPMYLVCTNARRDACCGEYGRRFVESLVQLRPDATWECSHIGGHRFAPNLVCLPHGLVYGRVDDRETGVRIVSAYEAGRVVHEYLRGRNAWPAPAQAAEAYARRELGIDGIGDLRLAGSEPDERPGMHRVTFTLPDARSASVLVRERASEPARPLSCGKTETETPPTYLLVGVEVAARV